LKWTGSIIGFVWVPSHCGVRGNEGADRFAKEASRLEGIDIPIKWNLSEAKSEIRGSLISEWQDEWNLVSSNSIMRKVNPNVSLKHNSVNLGRRDEIMIHRLRLGKCALRYYLFIMGKHHDGMCDVCAVHETIEHVLIFCGKYNNQRKVLFNEMTKSNKNPTIKDILGGKIIPFICQEL
jgi:hypothetical protein